MATKEMPSSDEMQQKYPSNSHVKKNLDKMRYDKASEKNSSGAISSEPEPGQRVQPVTQAKKVKKKGALRRIAHAMLEDNLENAKERAVNDIIIPGFKALIFDGITDLLDAMLYGNDDRGYRGSSQRRSNGSRRKEQVSYNGYYEKGGRRPQNRSGNYSMEPDEVILDTRNDARNVLNEINDAIRKYGQASIADFYDACKVTSDWTDNRYGWYDIRGASIKPVRDGYIIIMPPTEELDN